MAFAVKYRLEFDTIKNRAVRLDIEEDGFIGTITELEGSANPVSLSYPNAQFNKVEGIRESRIEIRILSGTVTASDFLTTSDTQYKVKLFINNTLEWTGWLDNDRLDEPYLDTQEEIRLTGSDGLSLLKSVPLTNLLGQQIWGIDRVKNFIAFALDKTELGLDYWSFINMYPVGAAQRGTNADFDAFYYSHITSFTFLEGPRDYNDCYTVLSKIMQAFGCTLMQARGAWYIVQLNDRIAGDLDGTRRNASGVAQSTALNQDFSFDIGLNRTHNLVNADALVSWEKAFKHSILTYRFLQPPIYFRNWDLQEGAVNIPLSTGGRTVINLDHWQDVDPTFGVFYGLVSEKYGVYELQAGTNAELVRYIMFQENNDTISQKALTTTTYLVNANDTATFSFSRREKNAGFQNTRIFCFVKLTVGSDYYTLDEAGNWNMNVRRSVGFLYARAEDRRFWRDYSITSKPFPASGFISITFTSIGHSRTNTNEVHFKDIAFTVNRFFAEMATVDGYEQKVEQSGNIKNEYDNQLYISNSLNVGIQGCILASTNAPIEQFKYYNALDSTAVEFSKYINRAYWRAMYRNFVRLEGQLFDVMPGGRLLSVLNSCRIDGLDDLEFLITSITDLSIKEELAQVTMIELRDTSDSSDFTEVGNEFFKYTNLKAEYDYKVYEEKLPIDSRFGDFGNLINVLKRNKRRRFNNYG